MDQKHESQKQMDKIVKSYIPLTASEIKIKMKKSKDVREEQKDKIKRLM